MKSSYDVGIVGGGPVGLLAALLLSRARSDVVLIRPRAKPQTGRSVALMMPSVATLQRAGVWDTLLAHAAPLTAIRIVDATGRLLRAPTMTFRADDAGLPAFAMNIENDVLVETLERAVAESGVYVIDDAVETFAVGKDAVMLSAAGFSVEARAVVAADGRKSRLRAAAGIETHAKTYPQTAVTAVLNHVLPHHGVSTEFHTVNGPMTFVPMGQGQSALVLVTTPNDAANLMAMSDSAFAAEVSTRSECFLGVFQAHDARGAWPLTKMTPARFARNRIFLGGEAAHVLPPIGAQGLNLGFQDAACLADLIGNALQRGSDPGAETLCTAYDAARRGSVLQTGFAVDALNMSLLSPYLPVHMMRGFGLYMAQKSRFFRTILMRSGLSQAQGA